MANRRNGLHALAGERPLIELKFRGSNPRQLTDEVRPNALFDNRAFMRVIPAHKPGGCSLQRSRWSLSLEPCPMKRRAPVGRTTIGNAVGTLSPEATITTLGHALGTRGTLQKSRPARFDSWVTCIYKERWCSRRAHETVDLETRVRFPLALPGSSSAWRQRRLWEPKVAGSTPASPATHERLTTFPNARGTPSYFDGPKVAPFPDRQRTWRPRMRSDSGRHESGVRVPSA